MLGSSLHELGNTCATPQEHGTDYGEAVFGLFLCAPAGYPEEL